MARTRVQKKPRSLKAASPSKQGKKASTATVRVVKRKKAKAGTRTKPVEDPTAKDAPTSSASSAKKTTPPAATVPGAEAKADVPGPVQPASVPPEDPMIVTLDRRQLPDRRSGVDRRQQNIPVAVERRQLERRAKVPRRRQIDPTTCERDYTPDEIEFMKALEEYKRLSGRMFPTCSEILEVLRNLGYEKRPKTPAEGQPPDAMPPRRDDDDELVPVSTLAVTPLQALGQESPGLTAGSAAAEVMAQQNPRQTPETHAAAELGTASGNTTPSQDAAVCGTCCDQTKGQAPHPPSPSTEENSPSQSQ